jgi:hypothetical protein
MTATCTSRRASALDAPCGKPAALHVVFVCVHEHIIPNSYTCADHADRVKFCLPCWKAAGDRVPLTEVKREPVPA